MSNQPIDDEYNRKCRRYAALAKAMYITFFQMPDGERYLLDVDPLEDGRHRIVCKKNEVDPDFWIDRLFFLADELGVERLRELFKTKWST